MICSSQNRTRRCNTQKIIRTKNAPEAISPYSQAEVEGGIIARAWQALENLTADLMAAVISFEHVVRMT